MDETEGRRAVVVIAGAPASGKTSLAHALAGEDPRGVHVQADVFFRFPAHRIDPSLPQSRRQNEAALRACAAAAREYAAAGYAVYLDGVIGPWSLPLIGPWLGGFDYVLLQAPLDTLLARAAARTSQPSADVHLVRRMQARFAALPASLAGHTIDTGDRCLDEVAGEYRVRAAKGGFSWPAS
ncbi:AAA family ATPase [Stenotrophomonas mori]|uniref:AAA family ATPase n=1 Tax=Stenotrophomonas mori TaxID=2871096 RepID=A0ABT0SCS7_9GAMM|nr:AAA family ATPase [Stenotrophomonas mori]MCL7713129.1 AAA family ATPase [Stenotrophomonas mori]